MATHAQRIADLEREVAALRSELNFTAAVVDVAYAAGRESITNYRTAAPPPAALRTGPPLRLIPGGLETPEAEAEPEIEIEAGPR